MQMDNFGPGDSLFHLHRQLWREVPSTPTAAVMYLAGWIQTYRSSIERKIPSWAGSIGSKYANQVTGRLTLRIAEAEQTGFLSKKCNCV
jgi:hypothetical protein